MSYKSVKSDISELACLSKLKSDGDFKSFRDDFNEIIELFKCISEVECSTNTVVEKCVQMRQDEPFQNYERTELLANAKNKTDKYICVPPTVEQEI